MRQLAQCLEAVEVPPPIPLYENHFFRLSSVGAKEKVEPRFIALESCDSTNPYTFLKVPFEVCPTRVLER
jgi:hypothetical protein